MISAKTAQEKSGVSKVKNQEKVIEKAINTAVQKGRTEIKWVGSKIDKINIELLELVGYKVEALSSTNYKISW